MSPWLTFVIGIILGLLVGWLIDLLYRRAPRAESAVDAPAPEIAGVVSASAVAVAAISDEEGLDVPPGSDSVAAVGAELRDEPVDWREVSARVDEVASETDAPTPGIESEPPPAAALPPFAAGPLAPDRPDARDDIRDEEDRPRTQG